METFCLLCLLGFRDLERARRAVQDLRASEQDLGSPPPPPDDRWRSRTTSLTSDFWYSGNKSSNGFFCVSLFLFL